jgi:two-component system, sensor histidine kinase LadS
VRPVFAIIIFFLLTPAVAAAPFSENITGEFEYLQSLPGAGLTEVLKTPPGHWRRCPAESLDFAFSRGIYWLRPVKAEKFLTGENRLLVLEWKTLDRADFHALKNGIVADRQSAGDTIPYADWSVSGTYYPTFSLPRQGTADSFLIRMESTSFKSFPVKIQNSAGMLASVRFETGIIWLYGGLVFVLILLSLFMFLITSDRIYLYYAGYILSLALFNNLTFGNAYAVFWPSSPWFQNHAVMSFLGVQIACSVQFVRHLLGTKDLAPRADRVMSWFAWIALLTFPLPLLGLPQIIFSRLYTALYTVLIPFFYYIGLRLIRYQAHIRVFVVGWSILFFFAMIQILYYLGVLPFSYTAVYGVVFVFPIDLCFFSYSIWRRYDTLRREHNEIIERLHGLSHKPRYARSRLSGIAVDHVLVRMDGLLKDQQLYRRENLKLEQMAALLRLKPHQLSEIINSKFGRNFSAFINLYRIGEAKRLLTENPEMTILAIAFETGFGSKTQFNVLFKRETGVTPAEFRKKIRSGS